MVGPPHGCVLSSEAHGVAGYSASSKLLSEWKSYCRIYLPLSAGPAKINRCEMFFCLYTVLKKENFFLTHHDKWLRVNIPDL